MIAFKNVQPSMIQESKLREKRHVLMYLEHYIRRCSYLLCTLEMKRNQFCPESISERNMAASYSSPLGEINFMMLSLVSLSSELGKMNLIGCFCFQNQLFKQVLLETFRSGTFKPWEKLLLSHLMAGTRIAGLRIIAFNKITIRNKYVSLTQRLIFYPMLQYFILKSSHMLSLILCQFTMVLSIRSWPVNSKSRQQQCPHKHVLFGHWAVTLLSW